MQHNPASPDHFPGPDALSCRELASPDSRAGVVRQACLMGLVALLNGGRSDGGLLEEQEPCDVHPGEYHDGQQHGLDAHRRSVEPEPADNAGRDRQYRDQGVKGNS